MNSALLLDRDGVINVDYGYVHAKDNFVSIDSLYVFHEIDSITFVQSNMYYASKPKLYAKILESAKAELERFQEQDTLPELEMPIR